MALRLSLSFSKFSYQAVTQLIDFNQVNSHHLLISDKHKSALPVQEIPYAGHKLIKVKNLSSNINLPSSMPAAKPKSRFASLVSHHAREPVDSYRPGGYHPVHFGDSLCNGRYEVVRKLGFGETSTVWLARNTSYVHYKAFSLDKH